MDIHFLTKFKPEKLRKIQLLFPDLTYDEITVYRAMLLRTAGNPAAAFPINESEFRVQAKVGTRLIELFT